MSQTSGFDLSKLSTASKILLGAGILYLIDLFLPWQRVCIDVVGVVGGCGGVSGAGGIGILNLLLVIALIVWEGMAVAGRTVSGINAPRALISAALAGAIVLFTLLKILIDNDFIYLFAYVGLILAIAIGYGGWMRWQEHQAGGGGMSSGGTNDTMTGGGGFTG